MTYSPIESLEDAEQRLKIGATKEDRSLEFKRELGGDNRENARDIAQFANAVGGTLVIGAAEVNQTLTAFHTVLDPTKIIARLDNVVKDHLTPVPIVESHALTLSTGVTIIAVNVPPSVTLIARHEKYQQYEFVIRAGESKRFMSLLEVEDRMQDQERRARLRLEKVPPDAAIRIDAPVHGVGTHGWKIRVVSDDSITLWIDGLTAIVPLTYVAAVYSSGEPGAEWVLDLSCEMHARPNASLPHILVIRRRFTG